MSWWIYSCTTHIININQAGVGYYLHREGPNLGKNIVSLVSCYHPALTHSSGPPTRDLSVLTPTPVKIILFGKGPEPVKKANACEAVAFWKRPGACEEGECL